jgi:chaperonin GroEL|tara:strand:+ start:525 stop:2108 length:1584 start_codon:yes stop_codon:yes gene_type:complete
LSKHYEHGTALSQKILNGVNLLADYTAATLGPRGRNVILQSADGKPIITKDGVTVARHVDVEDPFENVGAQIIKQASAQTNSAAGDGTTTATVLAREILEQSQRYLASGMSPIELKRGVDKAVAAIVENLKEMAQPIRSKEDIAHVATISANNDRKLGDLVATAVDSVGKDGAVTVEEARSLETSLDLIEGFRFDSGYVATAFVTDTRRNMVRYDDPLIMVTDSKIERVDELMPALEIADRSSRPLIIVADEVEGQALAALIMNAIRRQEMNSGIKVAAVKAPRYGEDRRNIMQDLALSTGATFINLSKGMSAANVTLADLGTCKTVEITKGWTTVAGGAADHEQVAEQITSLKAELEQTDSLHECEKIQERITRLASGVAVIRVGAATEVEMTEKRHRIEDALEAVRSAQQEGIVPGGGVALIRASESLGVTPENEEQRCGIEIVKNAVYAPLYQMAKNAGESADLIVSKVMEAPPEYGWDFHKGGLTEMISSGIIDPVKVTRSALQNAASAAGTLFTTSHAIIAG